MYRRLSFGPLILVAAAVALAVPSGGSALADSFRSGENAFNIEFVPIGDPGNVADSDGEPEFAGSVPYNYRIGKYEISEQMIEKANAATAGTANPLEITIDDRGPNKPATSISWFEAARFVNWLNTSTGATPAYKFDANGDFQLWTPADEGYDPENLFRNRRATYFLPSSDEWYKAAYYDPATGDYFQYPTGSDSPPAPVLSGTASNTAVFRQGLPFPTGPADVMQAGGLSPYGTMAQGGNVGDWLENERDLVNDDTFGFRSGRGGSWDSSSYALSSESRGGSFPQSELLGAGFRVASIPEPRTHAPAARFGVILFVCGKIA